MSDNWGEFNNELLREVCEQFNITIKSTAAEAPWSNGIVERHNTVVGKMIKKLKLDNNNTYSIVPWAIKAKNALQSCYALAQTNFKPSNLVNLLPATEDVSHADILVKKPRCTPCSKKSFYRSRIQ